MTSKQDGLEWNFGFMNDFYFPRGQKKLSLKRHENKQVWEHIKTIFMRSNRSKENFTFETVNPGRAGVKTTISAYNGKKRLIGDQK